MVLRLPPARALLGTITQDRTGLTDRYTMELDYPFALPDPAAAAPPEFAGPFLSTAVREQWGLRLVPGKGRLKAIIVESAQLPTGNLLFHCREGEPTTYRQRATDPHPAR